MFELNAKFIILCNLAHLKDDFCLLQLGSYFSKFGLGSIVLTQVNDEISEQSNITTANQTEVWKAGWNKFPSQTFLEVETKGNSKIR